MSKSVFLHVYGDDYSAMHFEENFNVDQVYDEMFTEGVLRKKYITDDYYIEVQIVEFGYVDPEFFNYVFDQIVDYDQAKHENMYRVGV